jgi:Predicted nucleotide-binding protein containing TIR-like domain
MSASQDLFKQINNAVIDLQASDLQSYPTPLRRIGRLLQHDGLQGYNNLLTAGLDLEDFLSRSNATQKGMVGSAQLLWPEDDVQILGLKLLLIRRFCDEPEMMMDFGHDFFWTGSRKIMGGVQAIVSQIIIPFVRDYRAFIEGKGSMSVDLRLPLSNKVFIVHGHDGEAREAVARYLTMIGFDPIILNEQANKGRTVIEKVEAHSDVGFAVVLLTADDVGRANAEKKLEPRARQNVLLELGYFLARLGRANVCAFRKGDVSIPSDFAGVVWESMDGDGWKLKLARELKAAGHTVDVSKILG